ncbi:MAG: thioredoxin family protein [Nitrospirales bacterium]|nr:thioredoxin family protein [Nitrospirales bacterium]
MALTISTMLALGTTMPDFQLPDVCSGHTVDSQRLTPNELVLVMFICRHCPYVVHIKEELARLGRDYQAKPVSFIAISSNDAHTYPLDAPGPLAEMVKEMGFTFPLCYDESQSVARAFTAACTPDFFLFDQDRRLVYRGQLDESRPGNGKPVTGKDLRSALDAVFAGRPVAEAQRPSAGCNIKWKRGQEPKY